jgi:iron(III) transport system permease protein
MAYIVVFGPAGWLRDVFGRPPVQIYSFGGIAFVLTMFTYPYVLLISAALLRRMSREYEEVALAAGVTRGQLLRRVTLPFLRPAMGAGGVLVVLYVLADFGAVTMLRYTTFTSAIYFQIGTFDMAAASALSLTLILISLAFVWLEHKTREQLTVYQTHGTLRQPLPVNLGPWKPLAVLWVGLVALFAVALPLGVLVYWSWAGLSAGGLGKGFWEYTWNSVRLAGLAAALCVAASLPLVYLESRHPSPVSRLAGVIAHAGHALPGVVVALGLVFVINRYAPFLYRSGLPLVLAYSVRFLTQSLRAGEAAMSLVPPSLDEAGRSLGLTPSEASTRITWPLIRPGLMAGGLLVFVSALKELPATLLLRPPGMDTLAVRVWVQASEGYFSAAAPIALLIVAISIVPLRWMLKDS